MPRLLKSSITIIAMLLAGSGAYAQQPLALERVYIPDFSYAGYRYGETQPNTHGWAVIDVAQHDLVADDGIDDGIKSGHS